MAAKNQQTHKSNKRKQISSSNTDRDSSKSKKPKLHASFPSNKPLKKPFNSSKQKHEHPSHSKFKKPEYGSENKELSKRERRIQAKELAEARKKKRKPHYTLEQELASLWEKMRRRNIAKEDRSKLITEALQKMKGKIPEIAGSHVSSRVLQTCVKHCLQTERDAVFSELQPHILTLSCNAYAVHLVKKMLDAASKKQLAGVISSLRGHVASLLRHMVGSVVIEHAYQLGNASQKQELLMELFSTELHLFKDLTSIKESRLIDVISKLGLQKSSVLRHMSSVIQPILEKGIVDHSIIHRVLVEYLSIADQSSAADIIQQLSGPLLVRMIHTREGSKIGMLCVKHGSAKERKKIIKGMKGHISKITHDHCGCMVLVGIVSMVDDTKLLTKFIIRELQATLKEIAVDKSGRRLLLQLLHPNCSRYFNSDGLAFLNLSVPSLSAKNDSEVRSEKISRDKESSKEASKSDIPEENLDEEPTKETATSDPDMTQSESGKSDIPEENLFSAEGGKKDPSLRRRELLVKSGLAENLVDVCIEDAGELLTSNFGKEVIFEVAMGGSDGILHPTLDQKLNNLHETIAALAAKPKSEESEEEHVLENFHSSRTIRKLILDCPAFASTLWKKSLEGKCQLWAQGHSSKILSAYWESLDSEVRKMAEEELKPLIDGGILRIHENKQPENED
ncbi:LOW QUALITY PROTEIN: pumilio homolog 24-like [Hibiscus syriacus]|uniref:LOW QUALITY PROTEIN: pumilio homolog 24-like n=1 Tax=Hibiscus syriacus TaxID=106335 RepID=UPI001924EDFA|nr:LOW QUALITY PROTEIN: pumilio homolog 24-like [Hibiscus syriacus]